VHRFLPDGRYIPFAVASTGEEGTGVSGARLTVRCARCEKAVALSRKWTLAAVVDALDSGKRFRHRACARARAPGSGEN
jgi:hypothetical protein